MLSRRRLLQVAGLSSAALIAARYAVPHALRVPAPRPLEGEAAQFVEGLFAGLDRRQMWDMHAHLIGTGETSAALGGGVLGEVPRMGQGTGCRVSESVRNHLNLVERFRYDIYLAATGVADAAPGDLDRAYVERLLALQRGANPDGRMLLLALDEVVEVGGHVRIGQVPFFTPNEYVLSLAREHPEFEAGVSIHPYRRDAVQRLDVAHAAGARLVKWLPSVQGINPSSPECDAFYERLAHLGLPLLTHAGEEAAMAGHEQGFGNPLLLRRPLDAGVKVIVAHGASLGDDEDLDAPLLPRPTGQAPAPWGLKDAGESEALAAEAVPGEAPATSQEVVQPELPPAASSPPAPGGTRPRKSSWRLLLRLMNEARYERLLFADLSAITQINRCEAPLRAMLKAGHLHHRFLNGSDYPLPAINPLISTWKLVREGYLTPRERELCNAVYDANPLLFDFAVKRCLKVEEDGRTHRLAPSVFETSWLLS